jgi:hypothetical protein
MTVPRRSGVIFSTTTWIGRYIGCKMDMEYNIGKGIGHIDAAKRTSHTIHQSKSYSHIYLDNGSKQTLGKDLAQVRDLPSVQD